MSNAKFIPRMKEPGRPVCPDPLGGWRSANPVTAPVSNREKQPAGMPGVRLNRVIAFIESHLASNLCVSTLATVAGMSPYYFCHSFKQSTGTTPHRYVLSRRMEQAKMLLEKNGASLLEIAEQVGFADQSQFTRVFHKIVGLTPSQFRKESSQQ
jgi:AraC family transcriptional regulator